MLNLTPTASLASGNHDQRQPTDRHQSLEYRSRFAGPRAIINGRDQEAAEAHLGIQEMWIFTKHGFFSAVCARQGTGKHGQGVDPDRIMVRARIRGHLDALKARFPDLLSQCEIHESAGTDYAFRLFVRKALWTQVLAGLAEETDYDNFKSEVAHYQGSAGAAYERSLHQVWSVMHRLQT